MVNEFCVVFDDIVCQVELDDLCKEIEDFKCDNVVMEVIDDLKLVEKDINDSVMCEEWVMMEEFNKLIEIVVDELLLVVEMFDFELVVKFEDKVVL